MSETTRLDLRISSDLLEKVRAIATEKFGSKIHHKSGKPEVTSVLIQLIQYGIEYLDNLPDTYPVKPAIPNYPDTLSDNYLDTLADKISGKLSGLYQDKEVCEKLEAAIAVSPIVKALERRLKKLEDESRTNVQGTKPENQSMLIQSPKDREIFRTL